ncbi:hypothetical protein P692DRAFT_201887723 [Suillus brevipes Sb2]|nr:hypothetical protein P692DRAFT_201887723 [Suillus brevipes Sb2]
MDIADKQQFKQYWGFQSIFVRRTITNVIGILIYDHTVTLPEEITFIWCHPKMLSAMFFLLNRYVALIGNIYGLFNDFLPATSYEMAGSQLISAEVSSLLIECLAVRDTCESESFSSFFNKSSFVEERLRVLFILEIIQILWLTSREMIVITHSQQRRYGLAWVAVFVYELLIFVLTIFRTCKTRGFRQLFSSNRNIIDIIFQDGAMYFAAMTLINIPNILSYYYITRGNLATFTGCMSVTLISRLVLNLHKSTDHGIFSTAIRDDGYSLGVFTTRISLQAVTSSHNYQTDSG